jgi:putative methionine-R-sulfoxide reductase with GAF domain
MESIISALMENQPPWFYYISSIIILITLVIIGIWAYLGAKRFYQSVDKENRIIALLEQKNQLEKDYLYQKTISDQLSEIIVNATTFSRLKNRYFSDKDPKLSPTHLAQSIIEALSSDIKTVINAKHRVGLWFYEPENELLRLVQSSANFYKNQHNSRFLDLDETIGGRCFRRKETIYVPDVKSDPDWEDSSDSSSDYSSIICIPINDWGILTIDAKHQMEDTTIKVCELYATIIESVLSIFLTKELSNIAGDQPPTTNGGD